MEIQKINDINPHFDIQNINLCITEQNKSPILIQISFITPTYQYFQGQWGRNAASILHKSHKSSF
jgi:hypothetical protein